jgi:hypothetical protein
VAGEAHLKFVPFVNLERQPFLASVGPPDLPASRETLSTLFRLAREWGGGYKAMLSPDF